jgi:TonB family protein
MTLPQQKPKREWRWLVVWSLFVFAGGLIAGPPVHDYTFAFIDDAAPKLATKVPWLFGWLAPHAPAAMPESQTSSAASVAEGASGASASAPVAAGPTVVENPAAQAGVEAAAAPAEPKTPHVEVREIAPEVPVAPVQAQAPRPRAARHASSARPAAAHRSAPVAAPSRKPLPAADPFESGSGSSSESSSGRRAKSSAGAVGVAKPEPSSRPAASRSSNSLDNLMADVAADSKGKGKKGVSKSIDDMLKDVQKSSPTPTAKREAPAPRSLEPLSASDISKAMSTVKTRANGCAKRLRDSGTAELKITVSKSGRVSDVRVGGKVSGTPLGTCVEKAVRAAVFRPNAGLRFDYRIDAR